MGSDSFDSLKCLRELRFMDETIYLRTGMLNIFNGMIGLTFSCDGSQYMPWQEFRRRTWISGQGNIQGLKPCGNS